ncbi:hypothetical protein CITRIK5_50222 [Citricoccus sp. K5]|nr:hypothetical protein CITRIK5_50222 [Citricoccus sp. K5]
MLQMEERAAEELPPAEPLQLPAVARLDAPHGATTLPRLKHIDLLTLRRNTLC